MNHLRSIPFASTTNEVDFVPCQICEENKIANTRGDCQSLDELLQIDSCKMHHIQNQQISCAICEKDFYFNAGQC